MALTFRVLMAAGNSSGGAVSVTKDAAVADGDILYAAAHWEGDSQSVTPPAGWTALTTYTNASTTPDFAQFRWWKRASSEPASWTFTPSVGSQFRAVVVVAYSGAAGTGDQLDVEAGTTGQTATTYSAPTITTTANSETVLASPDQMWSGGTPSYSSGLCSTDRGGLGGINIFEGTQSTAGATGASTYSGFGTTDYSVAHVAFKNDSGSGVTIIATRADFSKFPRRPIRQDRS